MAAHHPPPRHRAHSRHRAPSPRGPAPITRPLHTLSSCARWRHLPAVVGLGLVSMAVVVGGVRMAGADPSPMIRCADIATRYTDQLPAGWTLECADRLPTEWGASEGSSMSSRSARRIVVVNGQEPAYTEASIAHEIAHAEASGWEPEVRAAFASAIGQEAWAGKQGAPAPSDVFAESSVRCRGLPTHLSYPVVPCDLVEAARTAGGASASLPVSGTYPRG